MKPVLSLLLLESVLLTSVIDTSQWSPASSDPSGLTYLATSRRLVVVDGEVDETRVFGGSNVFMSDITGQLQRSFSTTSYSHEPADVATDRRNNRLFISDDNKDRIFRVKVGPDHRFGTRDDQVKSFSTASFGATDPEGLDLAKKSLQPKARCLLVQFLAWRAVSSALQT